MLLQYARRDRSMRVSRPPQAGEKKGTPIAEIDLRGAPKVHFLEGITASADETREIEEAVRELASTDPEKRAATFGYQEATGGAIKYYLEKATDLDRQLIDGTLRGASRTLRKASRKILGAQPPKPKVDAAEAKQAAAHGVSPEVVAEALYRAFAENSNGKIKGVPGSAKTTEIRGFWDLREVTRKALSQVYTGTAEA